MKKLRKWKPYLEIEVEMEYKACLYFFCILFFYCCYLISRGIYAAGIVHMGEMIITTYIMCYVQRFGFGNYDEAETFGKKEAAGVVFSTVIYTGLSFLFGWFDRNPVVTAVFAAYFLVATGCLFLVNKIKRKADTKELNELLSAYKEGGEEHESGH